MSTDNTKDNSATPAVPLAPSSDPATAPADPIASITNAMQSVDTNAPEAAANATSISDGNGGRIQLNDDPTDLAAIRK